MAHGLLGTSIVVALHPKPTQTRFVLPLFAGALFANAADFDFFLVFGLHSETWHRGFSHSLGFTLFVFITCVLLGPKHRLREIIA